MVVGGGGNEIIAATGDQYDSTQTHLHNEVSVTWPVEERFKSHVHNHKYDPFCNKVSRSVILSF